MAVATHSPNYCYGDFQCDNGSLLLGNNKYLKGATTGGTLVPLLGVTVSEDVFFGGSIVQLGGLRFQVGYAGFVDHDIEFASFNGLSMLNVSVNGLKVGGESVPIRSYQQIAGAHGFFNVIGGTVGTPDPEGVYNVDSVTDHGDGDYTINFINAMASADYSVHVTPTADVYVGATPTRATGSLRLKFVPTGGGPLIDPAKFSFAVFEGA